MSNETKVNRRDFLKLGGLAAVSLPIASKVGKLDGQDLFESEEIYGGFLVRQLEKDEPPYKMDEGRVKRFNATDVIFSRIIWDDDYIKKVDAVEKLYKANDPGYSQVDVAMSDAVSFCSGIYGTNSPLMGRHEGLLSLYPQILSKPTVSFEGRWDHSHLTPDEVTSIIKRAALYLGAQLVGIAPLHERWIYTHSYDILAGGAAPIEITEVEEVVLPEGQLSIQEAGEAIKAEMEQLSGEEIKTIVIDVLSTIDPALLPSDAPPVGIANILPASQFKENVTLFLSMPKAVLEVFAQKLGLDIVIADINPGEDAKPRYLKDGTLAIPETMKTVIVLAFEMDNESMKAAPTVAGGFGAGDGYSKMAVTAGGLAKFIRGLGYNAIPCGNNTAISVPQAIDAGLGEGGRNGLLITPKYGPRVRLAKVITDMPLAHDKPIKFGVEEFCEICGKCAEYCPSQAISYGEKSMEPTSISTNPGILKWSVDAEKCYFGWTAYGSGCSMCIKVCPFNKPQGWLHDATRILIGAKSGSLDKILLNLDDASGFGPSEPEFTFWESDDYIHIKD